MDDLLEHAHAMGLRVKFDNLGRRHGEVRSSGLIVVNDHRPLKGMRITLAHEIGHAAHGHDWTTARHEVARDERQAKTYAARLLITPTQYREAERELGTEACHLARALGVTSELIELWKASFQAETGSRDRHLYAV
jgi:Zn-dependent peptidase ImmA (M78 family)